MSVTYQNGPTTGGKMIAGSRYQSASLQRKAPDCDQVYPRRKQPTAADSIRADDADKEKEILGTAVDPLQSKP